MQLIDGEYTLAFMNGDNNKRLVILVSKFQARPKRSQKK
jgi:hypothetical protein